jgi:flagellin-like hook-associated protein FlgL
MLNSMTDVAATLGATNSRIELQNEFVADLMDTIDKGVGRLVDADMNEESTKLKALQTQQQLGIQALSIANSNSENILSLFR